MHSSSLTTRDFVTDISVDGFIHYIQRVYKAEKIIAKTNDKMNNFVERWTRFLSEADEFVL